LYKIPLTYLDLKVFGYLCFASTLENNRTKLEPRSKKCVFLGYKSGIKGYVLLHTKNKEIFINRNVIFYENIFSYKSSNDTSNINQINDTQNSTDFLLEPLVKENINFVGTDKRLSNFRNYIFFVNEN